MDSEILWNEGVRIGHAQLRDDRYGCNGLPQLNIEEEIRT